MVFPAWNNGSMDRDYSDYSRFTSGKDNCNADSPELERPQPQLPEPQLPQSGSDSFKWLCRGGSCHPDKWLPSKPIVSSLSSDQKELYIRSVVLVRAVADHVGMEKFDLSHHKSGSGLHGLVFYIRHFALPLLLSNFAKKTTNLPLNAAGPAPTPFQMSYSYSVTNLRKEEERLPLAFSRDLTPGFAFNFSTARLMTALLHGPPLGIDSNLDVYAPNSHRRPRRI